MSNPYDNLDFVSTKDLITLVTESVKSKFWDNLHPISRLHVIRTEGIFTPGTKGYGIGNRSFYGKLDERKLFKTPIFERWGEAVLFKLRTPDLTLKSVDSSHER